MSTNPTQSLRAAELTTPLGTDKLVLSAFHVHEELSRPYEIGISCISPDENVDFGPALGKHCVIRYTTVGKKKRYFSGILVEASWKGERDRGFDYELVLRPWLWLLTQTSDSRIFQNQSVVDIISEVFDKAGFRDYVCQVQRDSYPKIEYCVQYRETHFDFVSRLMEQHGIYYYFIHSESGHTLVLADRKQSHDPVPDLPTCRYVGMTERARDDEEYVKTWVSGRAFRTGKVTINAFDFDKPTASLLHEQTSPGGYEHDKLEHYAYPHKYKKGQENDLGQMYARAWLFAAQAQDRRRMASGDAASLFPGGLVKLIDHPTASENIEYLIISASHSFTGEAFSSGGGSGSGTSYHGSYVLQPSDRPYKAPITTAVPIIAGPQTATVVGRAGEEIDTDKHGRIKVQFHWDRLGKKDENSSRWVRVSQIWSGKSWGGIVLPRIGMEVVVEFIEGDPDRPLVVGCVYNAVNPPPYTLPDNKTISGVKSRSSKGGTDSNYNEFVFEDKKGAEYVRLHAEKDLNTTIEDCETRHIMAKNLKGPGETARSTIIDKGDDVLEVKNGDSKATIKRDHIVKITRNENVRITGTQTIHADGDILIQSGSKITLKVGGSTITITEASIDIKTNGKFTTDASLTDMKTAGPHNVKATPINLNC